MTVELHAVTADDEVGEARRAFRADLISSGLLLDGGERGLYLRSERFERICRAIDALVSRAGAGEADASFHFPLVTVRELLEQTDYVRSFPNLVGAISTFTGAEERHGELLERVERGEEWSDIFRASALALCSAACHPFYRTIAGQRLPADGRIVEIIGECFRNEPSDDPARMQVFRQHEFVFVGDPAGAVAHRDKWIERALRLYRSLGLTVEKTVANDPFFGRAGTILAINQRSDALKIEIVSPITSEVQPTAITSSNCHLDHFGEAFEIACADGSVAHSACVGFGLERSALALLATHGLDTSRWPASVATALEL